MSIFNNLEPVNIETTSNPLTIEILEKLENEITNSELNKAIESDKLNVSIAVEVSDNNYHITNLTQKIQLSENDRQALLDWLTIPEHTYYMDKMFRIDLENYIFLIKVYTYKEKTDNKILYGIAVHNTTWDKMVLLEQRQRYIMSTYM